MSERTKSSIDVRAPAAAVLGVITDFASYPAWAGEVKEARVVEMSLHDDEAAEDWSAGKAYKVWYRMDAGAVRDEHTLAYVYPSENEVRWTLVESTMMRALDGSYLVEDNGDGTCHVTYQLAVEVKIPMIGMIKRKAEKLIIERALSGLKKRVEAQAGPGAA